MTYNEIAVLGRGGFGIVHKVQDEDGNVFARKTFAPASYIPTDAYDNLRKRFKREVLFQKELGGEEILPVLDYRLDSDSPWFLMPLADQTYDKEIQKYRAGQTIEVDAIADILNALDFLHKRAFVHRDLNPKNILLHEGRWKLSDLGAVLPPTGMTVTLTDGTAIYTEQYCAPEQRNDFHAAQAPADIYSLGCIVHDIFGTVPRIPYGKQTADGAIGVIIEKCTDPSPSRRPSLDILRTLIIEALIEEGGLCKVTDEKAEEWLHRIETIDSWTDTDYDAFARFFATLNLDERSPGHEYTWVYSLSTPFLTRISGAVLSRISKREDGIAEAVITKYCDWVRKTNFLFSYSDLVCGRLTAVFDDGSLSHKAMTFAALVRLADSHHRFFIMREALRRCSAADSTPDVAKRLKIEIQVEGLVDALRHCVEATEWDVGLLHGDLSGLLK